MPVLLLAASALGGSLLAGRLVYQEFKSCVTTTRRSAMRRKAYSRKGDAMLRALMDLCVVNGLALSEAKDMSDMLVDGRIGVNLVQIVNEVKNRRGAVFTSEEAEFHSTMRTVVEKMDSHKMRPAHIAKWKYLVTVAVLTPTSEEIEQAAARTSETRREMLSDYAAVQAGPGFREFLFGGCTYSEWRAGSWAREAGQAIACLEPEAPVPRTLRGDVGVPTRRPASQVA